MLTLREICAAKRTSPPTVYRLIARGLLPPGERTGLRSVRWRESVVEAAYLRLNADRPSVAVVKQPGETSPQSDLEAAAVWLASQENPPMPVLPHVRTIFGLTPEDACKVAARAFELRVAQ
ncbi:helix-turn-helix transcriptional regulator [Agrobacterium burrii]|uniref:helix-turn-helix transcriptional regulator n=1 Tax=Agrobacterium burrii TaxID=2815339 RepID=UPI00350EB66D